MKQAYLFVLALAAVPACGKHNEVDVLHREAVDAAKFYAPQLDALDTRVQAIFQRGSTIPATTAGIDAVGARLTEARDLIVQMRGLVGKGPDGKSSVEKQADAAAKDHKEVDLERLVYDTHENVGRAITIINDDLSSVESWISYYDRQGLAIASGPRTQPGTENPAQPAPSTTGQPPPAAQPEAAPAAGSGAGQPRGAEPTPAQPGAQPTPPHRDTDPRANMRTPAPAPKLPAPAAGSAAAHP